MDSPRVIHDKIQLKFDDDMPQHFLFPSSLVFRWRQVVNLILPLTARSWIDAGTGIDSTV
jgi:hypothetical protein